jgi:uncharacterized protein YndB with AHSA1/START domain
LAVGILAVVLGVLATVSFASSAFGKDKPEEFTRIYNHTYDEVFQAAQEAIERKGWFVTNADKDKGTVSGHMVNAKHAFEMHIETVSPKPETRVTISVNAKGLGMGPFRRTSAEGFLSELQKVLVTYK